MATLGSQAVGSIVKMNVNGTAKEFIVVHQGKPSSIYDDSCNGTWLLMKDVYENRAWHSSNKNAYENSTIHSYLNGTFLDLFDSNIKEAIKQVKIPYRQGGGTNGTNKTGANGLSCKIFLLGGYEVGFTTSDSPSFPADGAKLSYFDSGTDTTANSKRIANFDGSANAWWLRSPYTSDTQYVWGVRDVGSNSSAVASISRGVRSALILPTNLLVSSDGTITEDPLTPKDGHNTLVSGAACQIEGGTVKLGGTAYEIEKGMVLIGGTAYEIPFTGGKYTVTISGDTSSTYAYVNINGTKIYQTGEYQYDEMPTIEVYVGNNSDCRITLNGETVKSGAGTYTLAIVAENVTIAMTKEKPGVYIADITTS